MKREEGGEGEEEGGEGWGGDEVMKRGMWQTNTIKQIPQSHASYQSITTDFPPIVPPRAVYQP